jgi:hypothetical protein
MKNRPSWHSASEADWEEACRREAVIRPLVVEGSVSNARADQAAKELGLSRRSLRDPYGDGRTPAHEIPTDTWPEKPPTSVDCSGAPAVPRWSPPRSLGRGCPTSPYQPNGRRESRRLGDHVGSANSTTQPSSIQRSPHRPDLPKTDPAADRESSRELYLHEHRSNQWPRLHLA